MSALSTKVSLLLWETRTIKLNAKDAAADQWNAEKPKLYKLAWGGWSGSGTASSRITPMTLSAGRTALR
jgi:hypothetical protein